MDFLEVSEVRECTTSSRLQLGVQFAFTLVRSHFQIDWAYDCSEDQVLISIRLHMRWILPIGSVMWRGPRDQENSGWLDNRERLERWINDRQASECMPEQKQRTFTSKITSAKVLFIWNGSHMNDSESLVSCRRLC